MNILLKNILIAGSSERTNLAVIGSEFALVQPGQVYERIIDCSRQIAVPGFVNSHGHAAMTLLRGVGSDLPLQEWLEKWMWPMEDRLTGDDVYWGTMLAILEMLKTGTTTFTDMYFFEEDVARAVADSGIRAVLSRGIVGVGPDNLKKFDESVEFTKTWNGSADGRITTMLGPHAPYTNTRESLAQVIDAAAALAVPIQIHLCETAAEVATSIKEHGKTPIQYVNDLGLLDWPVLAAHCVHLNDEDIQIIAGKNVRVAHCPGSNLKLGSGIAPVPDLLAQGVIVGLGTDGAASNNNLDMVEEMRLAAVLHKGVAQDPTLIPASQALAMATEMGAQALFLDAVGKIAPGMKADLTLFSIDRPGLSPNYDPLANIVYSAGAADIDLVMVDGQILVEKGQAMTIDEEKILYEINRCTKRIHAD